MSGFDEYVGHVGLRSFTHKLVALFVAAVIVGAGAAWLVEADLSTASHSDMHDLIPQAINGRVPLCTLQHCAAFAWKAAALPLAA